jgi:hypothetical protein
MTRRILILDAALLVLLVVGVARFRREWMAFYPAHQISAIQPAAEVFRPLSTSSPSSGVTLEDWSEIPSRNPFSFDRTDIAIVAPVEPPKPTGPKPVLFGTMSLGGGPIAMLATGQPGNRNAKPMKIGEMIDGWTIVEIDTKSVVIESNGSRETVIMNDPTAQIPRDSTRTLASSPGPSVVQASPAAPAPLITPPANNTTSVPPTVTSTAAPGQKRTRIMLTPFGPKVVEEDPQ